MSLLPYYIVPDSEAYCIYYSLYGLIFLFFQIHETD